MSTVVPLTVRRGQPGCKGRHLLHDLASGYEHEVENSYH